MSRPGAGVVPAATIAGTTLALVLVPLNSTMIAVALPRIGDEFDIAKGDASVLVTVYLVAMLALQPMAGRLCDAVGARRVASIATAGVGATSLAAMAVGSFPVLVAVRALQAAFASALAPSVQSMLREDIPADQRGRAFGLQGSVLGVGAGLGPVIGGLATSAFGWRAIFAVNLPVVAVVLHVLRRRGPERRRAHTDPGAADEAEVLWSRVFRAAFSAQALSTLAQYALLLAVPIVLDARGWSAASVGLALSFLTLGMVVAGPVGGRAGDVFGRRRPAVVGLAVTLVAVALSAAGGDDVPSGVLLVTLLAFGLGLGAANPVITTAGMEAVPLARAGAAAGFLSASRYVGSITSTLVLASVVRDDGAGLDVLLVVCSASLALALLASYRLPSRVRDEPASAAAAVDPLRSTPPADP
jgi:MFS family permease